MKQIGTPITSTTNAIFATSVAGALIATSYTYFNPADAYTELDGTLEKSIDFGVDIIFSAATLAITGLVANNMCVYYTSHN